MKNTLEKKNVESRRKNKIKNKNKMQRNNLKYANFFSLNFFSPFEFLFLSSPSELSLKSIKLANIYFVDKKYIKKMANLAQNQLVEKAAYPCINDFSNATLEDPAI